MTRELEIISAGWEIGVGRPLGITVNVVSRDLKGQPVHRIPLTDEAALRLARQILQSLESAAEMRRDRS